MKSKPFNTTLYTTVLLAIAIWTVAAPMRAQDSEPSPIAPQPSGGSGGSTGLFSDRRLTVNGKQRSFRLFVPSTVSSQDPVPLVFAFHGMFDSKDLMPMYTFLDFLAREKKFILVYPQGVFFTWPIAPESTNSKDDLAFYDAMYNEVTRKYNIDLNRVYLTGMSVGAYFTHLVAIKRSHQIAAIAPHSGSLGYLQFVDPGVTDKFAVLSIHGAADALISPAEGQKTRDLYNSWGHRATYLEAPGVGHFWAYQIDVNHKIWDFFMQHPRYAP